MKIIRQVQKECPRIQIESIGESDFILEYKMPKADQKVMERCKLILVSLIVFLGSAFTIFPFEYHFGSFCASFKKHIATNVNIPSTTIRHTCFFFVICIISPFWCNLCAPFKIQAACITFDTIYKQVCLFFIFLFFYSFFIRITVWNISHMHEKLLPLICC